jgi:glycosyltransferase involved in cell wall biosynthesis
MKPQHIEPDPPPADTPMRILLLPASYPPVLGGLQTACHALAREFQRAGHEVRVVTNRYPRTLPAAEVLDGVPVERWPLFTPQWNQLQRGRIDLFLAGLWYRPIVRSRLDHLLRAFRPDVVNVHFPEPQVPFILRARERHPFRLVVSLHGHDVERFTGPGAPGSADPNGDLRQILRAADAVTACSRNLLDQAIRLEPLVAEKGTAINNGIDPDRFTDTAPYPHPRPYVFSMGRLTRKKGFDLLIEAFADLSAAGSGVDLLLAGDGEEAGPLRARAAELGLSERITFLGRVEQTQIVHLLNGCALLAVPSRAEPFGIVALEGLAAGKPVLATRVGGMGPFLADAATQLPATHIRLVEPTAAELSAALREMLATPVPTEPRVARWVRENCAWERVARNYGRAVRA